MNRNLEIKNFVEKAKRHLRPLLDESGRVLYSSVATLKKGPLYILGLNPAGIPESFQKKKKEDIIRYSLNNLAQRDENAYTDEVWKRPALQKRLCWLVKNSFDCDIKDVCASNLIFNRSISAGDCGCPENADICWPVHEMIIKIVQPKMLLVYGNSHTSPFAYLLKRARERTGGEALKFEEFHSGHSSWHCKAFVMELLGKHRTIIGLPHLSRYNVRGKQSVANWVRDWFKRS
jgi:hypothetical protein